MGAITRGIKIYNVWNGDGDPVASVEFGVTVEDWGGRLVAVMTIDESDNKMSKKWDSGFSTKSDMRNYPYSVSGSYGTITLNDNGWYKNFLNGGYSLAGSRVERTWNESVQSTFSQSYIDDVKTGLGVLTLKLLDISSQMDSDVTTASLPLIVGEFENAVIKKSATSTGETPLFGGAVFKPSEAVLGITKTDEAGAPTQFLVKLAPSSDTFCEINGDNLIFPKNSYCRIKTGINSDYILTVDESTSSLSGVYGEHYYQVYLSKL